MAEQPAQNKAPQQPQPQTVQNQEKKPVVIPDRLTTPEALEILIQAALAAHNHGGILSVTDSELVSKAIRAITTPQNTQPSVTPPPAAQDNRKDEAGPEELPTKQDRISSVHGDDHEGRRR